MMNSKLIAPIIFGIFGITILVSLSLWQLQRLSWKEALIADIETRMEAAGQDISQIDPTIEQSQYAPVSLTGLLDPTPYFDVITSDEDFGAGYERIVGFETESGLRLLVVAGQLPADDQRLTPDFPTGPTTFTGNLYFPETTPDTAPDDVRNIWFGYDVPAMAARADTQEILVFSQAALSPQLTASPLEQNLPNNHRNYAITWALLALAWLIMSVYWGWSRLRHNK